MNLTGIIAISGKPGLYKVLTQSSNNIIVENVETNKKMPAFASNKISALEDISMYTIEEDVPLGEVFDSIFSKLEGGEAPSHKGDVNELKNLLGEVLPDYDEDRVYMSDIKKLFQWYNILQGSGELAERIKQDEEAAKETKKAEKKEVAAK